ncbi:hypothetical protein CALVIDRAFT_334880 [Calocera viscosa TUFC12733]|uniref:Secreted protein n=1 Tax=Calocera viscosa (strain TUFC12733) TaxID=1330018 RepID=A0A167HM17_CALVF|nr:hypothetical protein CALVIDRAFT_334880 [Calocera viscosa TUFC12733]
MHRYACRPLWLGGLTLRICSLPAYGREALPLLHRIRARRPCYGEDARKEQPLPVTQNAVSQCEVATQTACSC